MGFDKPPAQGNQDSAGGRDRAACGPRTGGWYRPGRTEADGRAQRRPQVPSVEIGDIPQPDLRSFS